MSIADHLGPNYLHRDHSESFIVKPHDYLDQYKKINHYSRNHAYSTDFCLNCSVLSSNSVEPLTDVIFMPLPT